MRAAVCNLATFEAWAPGCPEWTGQQVGCQLSMTLCLPQHPAAVNALWDSQSSLRLPPPNPPHHWSLARTFAGHQGQQLGLVSRVCEAEPACRWAPKHSFTSLVGPLHSTAGLQHQIPSCCRPSLHRATGPAARAGG